MDVLPCCLVINSICSFKDQTKPTDLIINVHSPQKIHPETQVIYYKFAVYIS